MLNCSMAVVVATAGAFLGCGITMPAAAFNLPPVKVNVPKPSVPSVRGNVAGAPSGNPGGVGGTIFNGSGAIGRPSSGVTSSTFQGGNSGAGTPKGNKIIGILIGKRHTAR